MQLKVLSCHLVSVFGLLAYRRVNYKILAAATTVKSDALSVCVCVRDRVHVSHFCQLLLKRKVIFTENSETHQKFHLL